MNQKVIPPKSFKFKTPDFEELIKELNIPRPLEQKINIGRGFYDLHLTQKKGMTCQEYKAKVDNDAKCVKNKSHQEVERIVD